MCVFVCVGVGGRACIHAWDEIEAGSTSVGDQDVTTAELQGMLAGMSI